jgi:branched-chain amino acid transport system permease protein
MASFAERIPQLPEHVSFTWLLLWILRIGTVLFIVIGSLRTLSEGTYSASQWLDLTIFGVSQGSVYSLIALGYTMVYGVLRFINFAHGEVFVSGALVGYFVAESLESSGYWAANPFIALVLVFIAAMLTSMIVAVLVERIAYRPLRGAPRLIPLITSIGVSFILQQILKGLFGAGIKTYPVSPLLEGSISILGFELLKSQALVITTALLMMAGLYLFVERTKTGRSMRAVAEDKEIAALMGISVDKMIVITFLVGGLMAGAGGALYGQVFRSVNFSSGFLPGIKAFTAAVLGGIGNIVGAMLGGLLLGVVESLGPILVLTGWGIVAPHQLKDVVAFTVLILVLIFRPTGILGEQLAEERA